MRIFIYKTKKPPKAVLHFDYVAGAGNDPATS